MTQRPVMMDDWEADLLRDYVLEKIERLNLACRFSGADDSAEQSAKASRLYALAERLRG